MKRTCRRLLPDFIFYRAKVFENKGTDDNPLEYEDRFMLKKEIQDNIIIATLSDGATNAVTLETLLSLKEIVDEVNGRDEIKGLVLTGEGRFFSSGFSLPMFLSFETDQDVINFFEQEEEILVDFFTCDKPVISAINGHCAAMGLILALASDYRIAVNHPKIKLGMSEIKIGLALSIAESSVVRFGLDSDKTFQNVMYFGEMISPEKALDIKMVDELTEADRLLDRAKALVSLWIDTPNRPFIQIKKELKLAAASRMRQRLKKENWQTTMVSALLNPDVKATLSFVQATMAQKKK